MTLSLLTLAQAGIASFGFAAIWFVNCETPKVRRWASVCGLIAQPCWFYATWQAGQWGIFALSFFYTFSWARGFYFSWLKK